MDEEKKKNITKSDVAVGILTVLTGYLIICVISWVVMRMFLELGFVSIVGGIYSPSENAGSSYIREVCLIYNLFHMPLMLYVYFLRDYLVTTLVVTGILGLIIWEMLTSGE